MMAYGGYRRAPPVPPPLKPPLRVYGTIRDSYNPDDRVKVHTEEEIYESRIKASMDLRTMNIPVYDQKDLGSCSANAVCSAYKFDCQIVGDLFEPSRLFEYYTSRDIEHKVNKKSGVSIGDCIKALNKFGICSEELWPYDMYKSKWETKPTDECYEAASERKGCVKGEQLLEHDSKRTQHFKHIHQLTTCLNQGSPFVFGFNVYENFHHWDGKTNDSVMPYPTGKCIGSHAVMAVGYNNFQPPDLFRRACCIIVLNSWGKKWGDKGFFYMPYHVITNPEFCFGFWKISLNDQYNDNQ